MLVPSTQTCMELMVDKVYIMLHVHDCVWHCSYLAISYIATIACMHNEIRQCMYAVYSYVLNAHILASSPGHSQFLRFNLNWEWPGDEATHILEYS